MPTLRVLACAAALVAACAANGYAVDVGDAPGTHLDEQCAKAAIAQVQELFK